MWRDAGQSWLQAVRSQQAEFSESIVVREPEQEAVRKRKSRRKSRRARGSTEPPAAAWEEPVAEPSVEKLFGGWGDSESNSSEEKPKEKKKSKSTKSFPSFRFDNPLGKQLLIASGQVQSKWGIFDRVEDNVSTGICNQVTKAALAAVGILQDQHYQFVSLPWPQIVRADGPGPAVIAQYVDAATSFLPTKQRTLNFRFGLPMLNGHAKACLWRLASDGDPLPEKPRVGILRDYAFDQQDLAASELSRYRVVLFDSDEHRSLQATVLARFRHPDPNERIDLLFFSDAQLIEDHVEVLVQHGEAFTTRKLQPALMVSRKSPVCDALINAYNEGLRRIVLNGTYASLVKGVEQAWTADSFPKDIAAGEY